MSVTEDQIEYIFKNYSGLLTMQESFAWKQLILRAKHNQHVTRENVPEELAKKKWRTRIEWLKRISEGRDEEKVQKLIHLGWEQFHRMVATRILDEHRDDIFLNLCPRCNALARTPQAKQCPRCYYSWHDKTD